MSQNRSLHSRRVVTSHGIVEATVSIEGEKIARVERGRVEHSEDACESLGDLVLMPGLVDPHVHINEPGRGDWEGFVTATCAAAAGGITTLVDMPLNSSPVTTSVRALQAKVATAEGQIRVDVGFHGGLVEGNAGEMGGLIGAGVLGVKAFLCVSGLEEFPPAGESDLRAAMPILAKAGVPLLVHAELTDSEAPRLSATRRHSDWLASRPRRFERRAIELMLRLCEETNCHVHIVHLSDADSIHLIERARAKGLPISVETCPHYLHFEAERVADGDTRFKCAPPIREGENRERLWHALRHGRIDMIASDHSPCPPSLKTLNTGDFARAWGGISSLQLGLPIIWSEARVRGAYGPDHLARWMSAASARLAGLAHRKGRIAPGFDADLVAWDSEASFRVDGASLHHRHPVTPYAGEELFGVVHATWLRGDLVYRDGEFAGPMRGLPLFRTR